MVKGSQMAVVWHVDSLKLLHKIEKDVEKLPKWLKIHKENYAPTGASAMAPWEVSGFISGWKGHDQYEVYILEALEFFLPEEIVKAPPTLAALHLFVMKN
eukprot:15346238-Ditylum_brightwellii.AAC.1